MLRSRQAKSIFVVTVAIVIVSCLAGSLFLSARDLDASKDTASTDVRRDDAKGHPAGTRKVKDPINLDAQLYAEDMGVSLEEANRRLNMQGDTLPTDLGSALKNTERDSFAGLWIRHNSGFGLTIATAGDPEDMERKIRPIVAGTRWEGTVNVKRVEASLVELNDARANAERMLDRLGILYSSGDNIMKNRMEIYVEDEDDLQRKLRAAGLELPEHIIVIEGMVVMMDGTK